LKSSSSWLATIPLREKLKMTSKKKKMMNTMKMRKMIIQTSMKKIMKKMQITHGRYVKLL
jgi:hypothetical protein